MKSINNQLLAQENLSKINYGLLYGKMGKCIANYCLSNFGTSLIYKKQAEENLEDIVKHVAVVESFNYSDGLAGIGYGIEWLAQNGYININTDEILDNVDDELYNSVVYSQCKNHSLSEGSLGKAMYFYKRWIAVNPNQILYKRICLKECLVLLSDEIHDFLLEDKLGVLFKDLEFIDQEELKTIAQILVFFEKMNKECINVEIIHQAICAIRAFSTRLMDRDTYSMNRIGNLYLLYSSAIIALKFQDVEWQKETLKWYQDYIRLDNIDSSDPLVYFMLKNLGDIFKIKNNLEPPSLDIFPFNQLLFQKYDYRWAEIWLMA